MIAKCTRIRVAIDMTIFSHSTDAGALSPRLTEWSRLSRLSRKTPPRNAVTKGNHGMLLNWTADEVTDDGVPGVTV